MQSLTNTSTSTRLPRRRRAARACHACHLRKVKCDVGSTRPCSNCVADEADCRILPRKRRKVRQSHTENEAASLTSVEKTLPVSSEPANSVPASQSFPAAHDGCAELALVQDHYTADANSNSTDEGENADALAAALDVQAPPGETSNLYYSGDSSGPIAFLNTLIGPSPGSSEIQYLLPKTGGKDLKPEDLLFLRAKGAFTIPTAEVCDELIRAFFHHVYPFLPIVNAADFLGRYLKRGCASINLLLLWAIFLAATNFVEPHVLTMAGYKSRKAMKRDMYQRAKVLYDNAYGDDQISLIQAVILLGFWYTNTEDRFEAWHWVGVAVSMCQTLGLHRSLKPSNETNQESSKRVRLLRRIWWSSFVRDRWLSVIKGRPMRIDIKDCTITEPTSDDLIPEIDAVSNDIRARYLPYDKTVMADLWTKQVQASVVLGKVLTAHRHVEGFALEPSKIEELEFELTQQASQTVTNQEHPNMKLFACQVRLFQEATVITLYRPVMATDNNGSASTSGIAHSLRSRAVAKVQAAAMQTNAVLEEIAAADLVRFMKPMSITTIFTAMQIHLLDYKSSSNLARRLAEHRLQLGIMILAELRETYWGADFILKLFQRALAKMGSSIADFSTRRGQSSVQTLSSTPDSMPTDHPTQYSESNLLIEDPLGPNSFFSTWPAWPAENDLTLGSDEQDIDLNSFIDQNTFTSYLGIT